MSSGNARVRNLEPVSQLVLTSGLPRGAIEEP